MPADSVFLPQEIIIQKRDGGRIADADIQRFVSGVTDETVTEGQIAALAMAIFLNGMTPEEGAALTLAMRDSGDVINWQALGFDAGAPIVDKHSTGGVGDKVSLMLAPIVAACGGFVPMISGRGLGHTGGTLDKLESISGYGAYPDIDQFANIVRDVGCSIIGQTGELAPADKRFYGIRDVTGTVESIHLITASILSKKLSAGLGSLVMDVKFGSGAFMKDQAAARALAENIVRVAGLADTPVTALLTDMNEVLGHSAGNAVELVETVAFLKDPASADTRLMDVTVALAAHMLALSGAQPSVDAAESAAKDALKSGQAAEIFGRMVAAQGGPADFMDRSEVHLTIAPLVRDVIAAEDGYVTAVDTRAIGMGVVAMGGGRRKASDPVDHRVGFDTIIGLGRAVSKGDVIGRVFALDEDMAQLAEGVLQSAIEIGPETSQSGPVVADMISA